MAEQRDVTPRMRGWRGWQAQPLLQADVREFTLTLGLVRNRIVMSELQLRDPQTTELLGMMSNPSLGGLTPQQASEWLHEWLDDALDACETWNEPFA